MKFQKDNSKTALTQEQKKKAEEMKAMQEEQVRMAREMREKREKLQARLQAYGTITDQLDMLWHDIDEGRLEADKESANSWYQTIKNAKENNPLPK